jgi:hypothetical protein
MAEALGETRVAALALTNLGTTALFEGKLEEACDLLGRSARLRTDIADQRGVAFVNSILAWALCRKGTHDAARRLLEAAEATLHAAGDRRLVYFARDVLAESHLREGDAEGSAAILAIDSISGVRRFGDRWSVAHGLALASWTSRLLGRLDQSDAFAAESLALRRAEQDRYGEAECLALLASTADLRGDRARAAELMQLSRDIRSSIGDLAGIAECQAELSRLSAVA